MKKILWITTTIFVVFMLFGACTSTKIYDKSVPLNETCKLTITNSIYVRSFDGKKWKWLTPDLGVLEVTIPSGRHIIEANIIYSGQIGNKNVSINSSIMSIAYEFKAGYEYSLISNPGLFELINGSSLVGLVIVDMTSDSSTEGLLTITGLEKFNGKYALTEGKLSGNDIIYGGSGKKGALFLATKIENGKVELPIWYIPRYSVGLKSYNQSQTVKDFTLLIRDKEIAGFFSAGNPFITEKSVEFVEGKAEIDFKEFSPK